MVEIFEASNAHLDNWLQLRKGLWQYSDAIHLQEMQEILASENAVVFLMFEEGGKPVGFIEGALYFDPPQPYGYVEGWYIVPSHRRQGLGGKLLDVLEEWFLHRGISLGLSDTIPEEYPLSPKAHAKYGYRELMTLRVFIKQLGEQASAGPDELTTG